MDALIPQSAASPTAAAGQSDFRDDHVYSAILLGDGGNGSASAFTVGKGSPIQALAAATQVKAAHQIQFTDLTTNLTESGRLGNGIGDVSVRTIAIDIEQSRVALATGIPSPAYGATPWDMAEVNSKVYTELKIGKKPYIIGAVRDFGACGGVTGSFAAAAGATTPLAVSAYSGYARHSDKPRMLKAPIGIARSDTLEMSFSTPAAPLAFSVANTGSANTGDPSLLNICLFVNVLGDVR